MEFITASVFIGLNDLLNELSVMSLLYRSFLRSVQKTSRTSSTEWLYIQYKINCRLTIWNRMYFGNEVAWRKWSNTFLSDLEKQIFPMASDELQSGNTDVGTKRINSSYPVLSSHGISMWLSKSHIREKITPKTLLEQCAISNTSRTPKEQLLGLDKKM